MMLYYRPCNIPFSLGPNTYSSLSNIQLKSESPLTLKVWSGFLKSEVLADWEGNRWVKPCVSHILLFSKNLNFKILGRMGKSLAHYKTIDGAHLAADLSQLIQRLESDWTLLLTTCLSACHFQYFMWGGLFWGWAMATGRRRACVFLSLLQRCSGIYFLGFISKEGPRRRFRLAWPRSHNQSCGW